MPGAFTNCQKRKSDRLKARVEAICSTLSHEERLAVVKRTNAWATAMIVAGFGCFIGLTAGLWHLLRAEALRFGIGSACMCWFGSWRLFEKAKLILNFDEEQEHPSEENEEVA
mmetsp:Transcript_8539/g.13312  ORF Transcript_8539/g.13312 Transcript_8539/m.13312 type:complete len:113 (+) Transcript_8539:156-494(+)